MSAIFEDEKVDFKVLPEFGTQVSRLIKKQHTKKVLSYDDWLSNRFSRWVGSWTFVFVELIFTSIWLITAATGYNTFDPPPYALLNLILSFQAEFAAPFIVMSQRVGDSIDRARLAAIRNQIHHSLYLIGLCQHVDSVKEIDAPMKRLVEGALAEADDSTMKLRMLCEPSKSENQTSGLGAFLERLGDYATDYVGKHIRSWKYIIFLCCFFSFWLTWNVVESNALDPYPFDKMNLALTITAAVNSPLVMMSALRQGSLDRRGAGALQLEVNSLLSVVKELLRDKSGVPPEASPLQIQVPAEELAAHDNNP